MPTDLNLHSSFVRGPLRQQATFTSYTGGQGGQALIIVLGFVMLMTVLILVFFASVLTERTNSKAAAGGVSARQLAQSAVQLVEATITQATVPGANTTTAWASQPGMIRTYGTGTAASSAPLAYYKLYSSNNMVINSSSTLPVSSYTVDADVSAGGDLLSNWSSLPALYTDLNAPVTASDGSVVFPIVDPRAASGTAAVNGFSYSNSTPTNSVTLKSTDFGTTTSGGGTGSLLPMPVQWIYVLRDGTLTSPTEPGLDPATVTNVANFSGVANAPTAANPIVGRIAFWTDDETAKVNLNTASEGTYWDTPMSLSGGAGGGTNSTDKFTGTQAGQTLALGDMIFTNYIPASHEYQRYPGHPATTCLSEVFGSALASLSPLTRSAVVDAIDGAVPRTSDGSSVPTSTNSTQGGTTSAAGPLPLNFNRLYPTVDDFNFTPTRTAQNLGNATTTQQIIEQSRFFLTTSSKAPDLNPFGLPKITIWPIWDDAYAANRSTLDGTMLHCSTVANGAAAGSQHRMIFQRENSASPTVDYSGITRNQQLYQYLQTLTNQPIPGFGGAFTPTKYTAAERDQILTEIFDYIRCTDLADQSGPNGSAGSYTPTASTSATTLNVRNGNTTFGSAVAGSGGQGEVVPIQITQGTTTQGMGRIATIAELTLVLDKCDDRNSTSAAETSTTLAPSVTVTDSDNAGGVQWCPANGSGSATTLPGTPANTYLPNGNGVAANAQTCVEWALFPKLSCPMAGYPGLANNIRIHYSNFQLQINGWTIKTVQSGGFVAGTNPVFDQYDIGRLGISGTESTIGGVIGPQMLFETGSGSYAGAPKDSFIPTGIVVVPGQSALPLLAGAATTMTVQGTFTVQIFSPAGAAGSVPPGQAPTGTPIQTLNFTFGPLTVPIPGLGLTGTTATTWVGTFRSATGYTQPPGTGANPTTGTFIYPAAYNTATSAATINSSRLGTYMSSSTTTDVSRSVVATGTASGDLRVIALSGASTPIPATAFAVDMVPSGTLGVAPTAPTGTTFNCNSERTGVQSPQNQMGQTSLCLPELYKNYGQNKRPPDIGVYAIAGNSNIPLMTNATDVINGTTPPADWDNGPGLVPDGAFFNKVDEGTVGSNPNTTPASPAPYIPYMYGLANLRAEGLEPTQFFSPNQQLSSPVMFGSLPAGTDHPWRTLLFRPATLPGYQEASSTTFYTHPGGANPPDHLLLDFFRMPVVEPYAISEPLATAGKINLNTQIAPFTYITRTTGLRAVLKSVMLTAFNPVDPTKTGSGTSFIICQKGGYYYAPNFANVSEPAVGAFTTRYPIDLTNTINLLYAGSAGNPFALDSSNTNGYDAFPEFNRTTYTANAPNFFISPSQICDLPLIPLGSSLTTATNTTNAIAGIGSTITSLTGSAGLGAFWSANSMTGGNSLDRPYSLIYPRVTTQSNTFTVHVRAQSLQKVPATTANPVTLWTEGTDQVTGEYRGSFTIEKYYDPTNATIYSPTQGVLTDSADATIPADARVAGPAVTVGATTTVQSALWRLLYDKRFGQ